MDVRLRYTSSWVVEVADDMDGYVSCRANLRLHLSNYVNKVYLLRVILMSICKSALHSTYVPPLPAIHGSRYYDATDRWSNEQPTALMKFCSQWSFEALMTWETWSGMIKVSTYSFYSSLLEFKLIYSKFSTRMLSIGVDCQQLSPNSNFCLRWHSNFIVGSLQLLLNRKKSSYSSIT